MKTNVTTLFHADSVWQFLLTMAVFFLLYGSTPLLDRPQQQPICGIVYSAESAHTITPVGCSDGGYDPHGNGGG